MPESSELETGVTAEAGGALRHPFSAWLALPEQLLRTLVGRRQVLEDLLCAISAVEADGSPNHTVLIGPWGIGKTHLLALLYHLVARRLASPTDLPVLSDRWVTVCFGEEEFAGLDTLANFLLALIAKIAVNRPGEELLTLPEGLPQKDDRSVCEICLDRLQRLVTERGWRFLLLIDNLQQLLRQWSHDDHGRLRAFLGAEPGVMIIGSAPSVFREILAQDAPFHQFFEIRPLRGLDTEQVLELLRCWFREENRDAEFASRETEFRRKVSAILVLTGGNPRLVLFLFEAITRQRFFEIDEALGRLTEDLREYFMRRFVELPLQPRKILDTLAKLPGPATPTEIARAARLRRAQVITQLKRLAENRLVVRVKLRSGRHTHYEISERLFRIWLQTATVDGRKRFRSLIDFLSLYFTHGKGLLASFRREASLVPCCKNSSLPWLVLGSSGKNALDFDQRSPAAWRELGAALAQQGRLEQALEALQRAESLEHIPALLVNQIWVLGQMNREDEALALASHAQSRVPCDPEVLLMLGAMLIERSRIDEALAAVDRAERSGLETKSAHGLRAWFLLFAGRYSDAQALADRAADEYQDDRQLDLIQEVATTCAHASQAAAKSGARMTLRRGDPGLCRFIMHLSWRTLTRGEHGLGLQLWAHALRLDGGTGEWFGRMAGHLFCRVLQAEPTVLPAMVAEYRRHVSEVDQHELLGPFLRAEELGRTGDLGILEQLFPEVREIVLEIARRSAGRSWQPDEGQGSVVVSLPSSTMKA